jgi:hypothetical protein
LVDIGGFMIREAHGASPAADHLDAGFVFMDGKMRQIGVPGLS